MAKLYFKYGTMGSSKTANLLITKFNYEEKGQKVLLLKPEIDTRDGSNIVKSRIGLSSEAILIPKEGRAMRNVYGVFDYDVILVDEAQFLTEDQIDQLHYMAINNDVPVICYGLLTDFTSHLFPGSKRLIEVAESIQEIKTICKCGHKATINARMDEFGNVITDGDQIEIGGNEKYESMCYACWHKAVNAKDHIKKPVITKLSETEKDAIMSVNISKLRKNSLVCVSSDQENGTDLINVDVIYDDSEFLPLCDVQCVFSAKRTDKSIKSADRIVSEIKRLYGVKEGPFN